CQSTLIRAFATARGFTSPVVDARYEIDRPPLAVDPVEFAPGTGTYTQTVGAKLQTPTVGQLICYTTDGSRPACSKICGGPVECKNAYSYVAGSFVVVSPPVDGGTTVVQALACALGYRGVMSDVTSATFAFPKRDGG